MKLFKHRNSYFALIFAMLALTGCVTQVMLRYSITSEPSGMPIKLYGVDQQGNEQSNMLNQITPFILPVMPAIVNRWKVSVIWPDGTESEKASFNTYNSNIHFQRKKQTQQKTDIIPEYQPHILSNYPLLKTTVAILTFDAKSGISASDTATLADRFEVEFVKADKHTIVNRSKMKEILDLQKFSIECGSSDCAIEAGQILGVQYIIYGSIGFIGNTYTINSYITDVEQGKTIASAATDYTGSIDNFLKQGIKQAANELLYSVIEKQQ